MIALTPRQRRPFILERDRRLPRDQQTVFYLRTLTLEERAELDDEATGYEAGGHVTLRVGTTSLRAVRAGLVAWENLKDEDGTDVPFVTETTPRAVLGGHRINPPTDETLDRLDMEAIRELGNEILGRSRLTPDDAKNS